MNEKSLVGAQQNVQMAEEEAKLGDGGWEAGEEEEHEQMSGASSQAEKSPNRVKGWCPKLNGPNWGWKK